MIEPIKFLLILIVPFVYGQQTANNHQRNYNNYPIAYNLFKQTQPTDINGLDSAHAQRAMTDVVSTIEQVQRVLESDPTLPRLTRGEIEELFENVTREEYERSLIIGDRDRAKHMRALMLVLPYQTNNYSKDNLQDIYNKPPMTRLVESAQKYPSNNIQRVMLPPKPLKIMLPPLPPPPTKPSEIKIVPIIPVKATTYRPMIQTKQTFKPDTIVTTWAPPKKVTKIVKPEKFSSHYSADAAPFMKVTAMPIRENVKDMLASIGLFTDATSVTTQAPTTTTTTTSTTTTTETIVHIPKTTKAIKVPELTPELKELLRSFGLLDQEPSDKRYRLDEPITENIYYPQQFSKEDRIMEEFKPLPETPKSFELMMTPQLNSNDFSSFKPLPQDEPEVENKEIADLLKSFGLLDMKPREKKSMDKIDEIVDDDEPKILEIKPEISMDIVPTQFASVLNKIGMAKKDSNHNFQANIEKKIVKKIEGNFGGFFQPTIEPQTNEAEYDKLNQLLETIKQLESLNTNLTESDMARLNLEHFNLSESALLQGPDPLSNVEVNMAKNEVKRQEDDNENPTRFSLQLNDNQDIEESIPVPAFPDIISESLTETKITTTTQKPTTTTTEISRISELEDTFGGGADPVTEEPLPQPRRNGFYFLHDINSFLEVGEDPDKVEVRYDRKFGDTSRFIPVKIP